MTTDRRAPGTVAPFNVQLNVSSSESELPATRFIKRLWPTPRSLPVADGVCDEQSGGEFRVTTQVLWVVLTALFSVAVNVLVPKLRLLERMFIKDKLEIGAPPFKVQETEQEGSLTSTEKFVLVELRFATLDVSPEGVAELTAHCGITFICQLQLAVS